jgi:hypothetical protein
MLPHLLQRALRPIAQGANNIRHLDSIDNLIESASVRKSMVLFGCDSRKWHEFDMQGRQP